MSLRRINERAFRSLFRKDQVDREIIGSGRLLEIGSGCKDEQGMSRQDALRAVRL